MRQFALALVLSFTTAVGTAPCAWSQVPDPSDTEITLPDTGREVLLPGVLEGATPREYTLTAGPGDRLTITLEAESASAYFDLLPPGTEVALHNGSVAGDRFEGTLPQPGTYTVRLYLLGAARDEGRRVAYDLSLRRDVIDVGALASEALAAIDAAQAPAPSAPIAPAHAPTAGGVTIGAAPLSADAGGAPGMQTAQPSDNRFQVANLSGSLNLRAGPSTTAAVIATVPLGAALVNRGCDDAEGRRWCQVQTEDGQLAWAAEAFLIPAPEPVASSETAASGAPFTPVGDLACTLSAAPARCPYAIERRADGTATLTVRLPDGRSRAIFVEGGVPVSSDAVEPFFMIRKEDLSQVSIGDAETYEIPDAVAQGG